MSKKKQKQKQKKSNTGAVVKLPRGRKRSTDAGAVKRALQSLQSKGLDSKGATEYLLSTGARRYLALATFRGQK